MTGRYGGGAGRASAVLPKPRERPNGYLRSDEAVLVGEGRRRGAGGHVELREDVADVPVDGPFADRQGLGDRPVGQAGRDEPQDLDLARAQAAGRRGSRVGPGRPARRDPGPRRAARTPRGPPRSRAAAPSRSPSCAAGLRRSGPGPGPLRTGRRAPATPPTPAGARASAPSTSPSASRTVPSVRAAIARSKRRIEPAGELAESIGCVARGANVAGGQRDLGGGLEHPRPDQVVGRLGHRAPDRRGRRSDVALRQPQQRKTGLRQAAPGAGLAIAGLGRLRTPPRKPVQLGQLVDRLADGGLGRRPRQPLARALRPRRSPRPRRRGSASARRGRRGSCRGTGPGRAATATSARAPPVHSCARRRSNIDWHASMTAQ